MILNNKNYMPVKDLALKRGCTVQHIYNEIKRGNLTTRKIGSFTLVEVQ
jgi:hypothetical protein